MLYLNPPFHVINGVSLFPDHQDPLQYYYLPLTPQLTHVRDELSKVLLPQIKLITYRGGAGKGGFLNLDVDLGLDPARLKEVRGQLKSSQRLNDDPRLAPVPLIDGTVKMMLFGKQTEDFGEQAGDDKRSGNGRPEFVLKINQAAKPALFGDNRASFSVSLDQYGVSVLKRALGGEIAPVGVVYSLRFLALRPAYHVQIHADWRRVQSSLEKHFRWASAILSTNIDKVVQELIDDSIIEIQSDLYVPEDDEHRPITERYEQAVDLVKDMVTDAFFEPVITPEPSRDSQDSLDKLTGLVDRIAVLGLTGGASALIGSFTYKKTDHTRIDRRTLNAHVSERTTVCRSIYPQGHLRGLFRVLREEGIDPDRFILSADLDDPWFRKRTVHVISRASFEKDSIRSIDVRLKYGADQKNVILETSDDRKKIEWNSIVKNGAMLRDVDVTYKVSFKETDGADRPRSVELPPRIVGVDYLEIDPRELYSIFTVPVVAIDFPWDRFPRVEVQALYTDDENELRNERTLVLDTENTELSWEVFQRDPMKRAFKYRLRYRSADYQDRVTPWTESEEQQIIVTDPLPKEVKVMVLALFDWSKTDTVLVEAAYRDPPNGAEHSDTFTFTEADRAPKALTFHPAADAKERRVEYLATVIYKDGRMVEVPQSVTLAKVIRILPDSRGHRIIQIQPEAKPFSERNLERLSVELSYEDAKNKLRTNQGFAFTSSEDGAVFEFDYMDHKKRRYRYRRTYLYADGLMQRSEWTETDKDELVLPLP